MHLIAQSHLVWLLQGLAAYDCGMTLKSYGLFIYDISTCMYSLSLEERSGGLMAVPLRKRRIKTYTRPNVTIFGSENVRSEWGRFDLTQTKNFRPYHIISVII